MKCYARTLLLVLFIFIQCFFCAGQNKTIDSLLNRLGSAGEDTSKVNLLNQLGKAYRISDEQKTNAYINEAILLAKKLNYEKGLGYAHFTKGVLEKVKGNNTSAQNHYRLAIAAFQKSGHTEGELSILLEMAIVKKAEGLFDEAFDCYEKMERLALKNNSYKYRIEALNGYANIYRYKDDYAKSISYYMEAIKLAEEKGEKRLEAISLANMAILYDYQHDLKQEIVILKKSLSLLEELKDSIRMVTVQGTLASALLDNDEPGEAEKAYLAAGTIAERYGLEKIGYKTASDLYFGLGYLHSGQNKYQVALMYYKKALAIAILSNEQKLIAESYGSLSGTYLTLENYEEALTNAQQQMKISVNIKYKRGQMDAAGLLAKIYSAKKDFKKAFENQVAYSTIRDAILYEESSDQMNEMKTKYETEKKDKELIKKDAEISKQDTERRRRASERNAFIIGFVLMIALSFFIFRGYRQKQKANTIISEQKAEVEKQKKVVDEKNKDILASIKYAQRIQSSLLPTEKYIERVIGKKKN